MDKISGVYQIVNTITGDKYVGSSNNVMRRWANHKCPSSWKQHPHSTLYKDFQKYGLDKFKFQILAPVMPENLKQVEQEFIDLLNPSYNNNNSKGWDIERIKETKRKCNKKYSSSDKGKKAIKEYNKRYQDQLCSYNGETLTLRALYLRFQRAGIEHPTLEAKKYLIEE